MRRASYRSDPFNASQVERTGIEPGDSVRLDEPWFAGHTA
jgi:hypothetical protein